MFNRATHPPRGAPPERPSCENVAEFAWWKTFYSKYYVWGVGVRVNYFRDSFSVFLKCITTCTALLHVNDFRFRIHSLFYFRSVRGTSQFARSSGPVPYTLHVFNGVKLVFRLLLSLPRKIVMITFMHCKAVVRIKVG